MGIVCAVQHAPELLILDEPTSGLDPLMQRVFFNIIRERNENGTTVFLSSHILSEVQRNCTCAAIIRDGRIIACGSVEALAKSGAKRITVYGRVGIDGLEGVKDLKAADGAVSFLYSGDMSALLGALAAQSVTDLLIEEPSLDDVFMHYYENGKEEDK